MAAMTAWICASVVASNFPEALIFESDRPTT
jgi:hypothetical protein